MRSIFYRSALLYDLLMVLLYRRAFTRRLAAVAALVPEGSRVLEVCCGPARLYDHLRTHVASYTGLDASPELVAAARRRGAPAEVGDLLVTTWPADTFDVVVIQASLYQFHPRCAEVIDALLRTTKSLVIVCEPIVNLASAKNPLIAALARRLTHAGAHEGEFRFDATSLAALMQRYAPRLVTKGVIPGGREAYYVLRAQEG